MKDERKSKRITVVRQERYDSGPFKFGASYENGSLDEVIASLAAIRVSIPPEYRAGARCEIGSESGYEGSHYASIEVSYDRPETDDEMAERSKAERTRAANEEARDREQLRRLQEKLGVSGH